MKHSSLKKIAVLVLSVCVLCLSILSGCSEVKTKVSRAELAKMQDGLNLFISPDGNDEWSGTLAEPNKSGTDGPLATLEAAVAKLQTYEAGATVWLRSGDYCLEDTLEFGGRLPEGCTFAAFPGEEPVIRGSKPVSGFEEAEINGVTAWKVSLGYDESVFINAAFDENGELSVTRFPEEGNYTVSDSENDGNKGGYYYPDKWFGRDEEDTLVFSEYEDVRVRILHYWKDEIILLSGVTEERIDLSRTAAMSVSSGERYFYENVLEALDSPGEWYYSRKTSELWYIPQEGENIDEKVIYVGTTDRLMTLNGAEELTFTGITFADTNWTVPKSTRQGALKDDSDFSQAAYDANCAILVKNSTGVEFSECDFKNIGCSVIEFASAANYCTVESCRFLESGGNAIMLRGENVKANRDSSNLTHDITVNNCVIDGYGRHFFNAIGLLIINACDSVFSHNDITDGYYTAISVGWVWGYYETVTDNLQITDNHIWHIGQSWLSDMGGIYTLGIQRNTVLRGNVIHDVAADPGQGGYGGWGIYFDEGSSGITADSNLVYDCSSQCLHQHYGEDNLLKNNIFYNGGISEIYITRAEGHNSYTLESNIIVSKDAPIAVMPEDVQYTVGKNLLWDTVKSADCEFYEGQKADSCEKAADCTVADPGFADPDNGDFSFANAKETDSLLEQIGFEKYDWSGVGSTLSSEVK